MDLALKGGGRLRTDLAGQGRDLPAAMLGLRNVPVIRLCHLTGSQRRACRIADTKLTARGSRADALLQRSQAVMREDTDLRLMGVREDDLGRPCSTILLTAVRAAAPSGPSDSGNH